MCVIECSSGYSDDGTGNCIGCISQGLFNQNGICKSSCDYGYEPDSLNVCYSCKNKLYYIKI